MTLRRADVEGIIGTAGRLGVDPGSLAGLMELESGINPNIWGGAGGKYRGLIQFGPGARSEVGLPSGQMTVSEQLPYVEKYFQQRGFKPGKHGVTEMYRTVLVGNPGQSGTDSFGTNSDKAAARMRPGGDLYKRGLGKLEAGYGGRLPSSPNPGNSSAPNATSSAPAPAAAPTGGGGVSSGGTEDAGTLLALLAARNSGGGDLTPLLAGGGTVSPLAAAAVSSSQNLNALIDDLGSSLRPTARARSAELEETGERRFASSPYFQQALNLLG